MRERGNKETKMREDEKECSEEKGKKEEEKIKRKRDRREGRGEKERKETKEEENGISSAILFSSEVFFPFVLYYFFKMVLPLGRKEKRK